MKECCRSSSTAPISQIFIQQQINFYAGLLHHIIITLSIIITSIYYYCKYFLWATISFSSSRHLFILTILWGLSKGYQIKFLNTTSRVIRLGLDKGYHRVINTILWMINIIYRFQVKAFII